LPTVARAGYPGYLRDADMAQVEGVLRARQPGLRFISIPETAHWVQYEATDPFHEALLSLLES
jgi:pimeloyl-ACP methyl ester carboxylesterase